MKTLENIIDDTGFRLYRYIDSPYVYYFERYATDCRATFPISSASELLHYLNKFYGAMREECGSCISIGRMESGVYDFAKDIRYLKRELGVVSNWITREDLKYFIKAVSFLVKNNEGREKVRKEIVSIIHKIKKFTNKEVS